MSEALVLVYIINPKSIYCKYFSCKINVRELKFKDYINLDKYFEGNTQQIIVGRSKYFIQYDPLILAVSSIFTPSFEHWF